MADNNGFYWDLIQEITYKENWYQKVFDEKIVDKWLDELPKVGNFVNQYFWTAICMLRATAQGSYHNPECKWEENKVLCDECLVEYRKKLEKDEGPMNDEEFEEILYDNEPDRCEHLVCGCKSPDSDLNKYIVYLEKNHISEELTDKLKCMINTMRAKDPVDWHPWSDNQVRDIIHPSLYCYVRGISKVVPAYIETYEAVGELVRYQWLPSDIFIDKDGNVTFDSYINNLHRKEYIPLFEHLLTSFVPHFEKVLGTSLKYKQCQVIVKVGSIHLDKNEYKGGSWHIEGMPYEFIAATGIHYLEVDNITPSFLEFRKPTIINEEEVDYPQNDTHYTSFHYGIENHHDGVMNRYLGLIRANEGASVVFPNTLQHRVKEFEVEDKNKPGLRSIIAFFLINPDVKIISTSNVPEQYDVMSLEGAKMYREKLMYQRKYYVDALNKEVYEREFSLCEH